jgi:hypothetical protein
MLHVSPAPIGHCVSELFPGVMATLTPACAGGPASGEAPSDGPPSVTPTVFEFEEHAHASSKSARADPGGKPLGTRIIILTELGYGILAGRSTS